MQGSEVAAINGILSLATCAVLYRKREYFEARGLSSSARRHMMDFSIAWLVLGAYYCISAVVLILQGSDRNRAVYVHLLDAAAAIVCAFTNLYLRRAVVHLSRPLQHPVQRDSACAPLGFAAFRRQSLRAPGYAARDDGAVWILDFLIGAACLLAVTSFLGMSFLGLPKKPLFRFLGYVPEMLLTAWLLFWIARVYNRIGTTWLMIGALHIYALLSVLYPLVFIYFERPFFGLILAGGKGLILVAALLSRGLVALPGQEPPDALKALAILYHQRSQKRYSHWAISYTLFITAILFVVFGLAHAITAVMQLLWPWRVGALVGAALVLFLLAQTLWAFGQYLCGYRQHWRHFAEKELYPFLDYEDRTFRMPGWHCERLALAKGPDPEPPATVIFLHGFLSSTSRGWGLLPIIMLNSKRISSVYLLTYKHYLWTPGRKLKEWQRTTGYLLDRIAARENGDLIVVAHSLGCLIALRSLEETGVRTRGRLKNLICVAAPLTGAWQARLGWPWRIPAALTRIIHEPAA